MRALWPDHQWEGLSCAGTAASYWVLYNEAMLAAVRAGHIATWYRVEDTDACAVASLGGFLNGSSVNYSVRAAVERASVACVAAAAEAAESGGGGGEGGEGAAVGSGTRQRRHRINKGRLRLSLDEIAPVGSELAGRMRALAVGFGYEL